MVPDKELYRQAYEQYRQWIEEGLIYLPRNSGLLSYPMAKGEVWDR